MQPVPIASQRRNKDVSTRQRIAQFHGARAQARVNNATHAAQHGVNADYSPSYNAADGQDDWRRMLAWFQRARCTCSLRAARARFGVVGQLQAF
jgi:dienelactone hydrolase